MNQSPSLLNKLTGTVNSYLDGIYVSNNGSPAGPVEQDRRVAEARELRLRAEAERSAARATAPASRPGTTSSSSSTRANANHVYAGLEEVYETTNGGSSWNTVGPYWNFYFPCWAPDAVYPPNGSATAAR